MNILNNTKNRTAKNGPVFYVISTLICHEFQHVIPAEILILHLDCF